MRADGANFSQIQICCTEILVLPNAIANENKFERQIGMTLAWAIKEK